MSRYIDADLYAAELWKLRENYQMLDDTHTADKIMHGIFRAEQVLKEQPTVDAVPVVRCRDCKWAEVDAWWTYCKLGHKEDTTNSIIYTCTHNFYCADGERRTDGK